MLYVYPLVHGMDDLSSYLLSDKTVSHFGTIEIQVFSHFMRNLQSPRRHLDLDNTTRTTLYAAEHCARLSLL